MRQSCEMRRRDYSKETYRGRFVVQALCSQLLHQPFALSVLFTKIIQSPCVASSTQRGSGAFRTRKPGASLRSVRGRSSGFRLCALRPNGAGHGPIPRTGSKIRVLERVGRAAGANRGLRRAAWRPLVRQALRARTAGRSVGVGFRLLV